MKVPAPTLWTGRDRRIVALLNGVGLFAIVVGWMWASGETLFDDQLPATNVAIVGLMVTLAGNVVWLLAGRRSLRRMKLALFVTRLDGP